MFNCCIDKKILEQVDNNNKILSPIIIRSIPQDEETVARIAAHVSAVINVSKSLSIRAIDMNENITEGLHDIGPEIEEPEFVPIVVEPVTEPVTEPITGPITVPVIERPVTPVSPVTPDL